MYAVSIHMYTCTMYVLYIRTCKYVHTYVRSITNITYIDTYTPMIGIFKTALLSPTYAKDPR